jgi:branched-chain amino acid transport system permease protein
MEYLYTILVLIGIWIILATSFDLIIGYGGLISIAHPIFFALGAYTSALLSLELGVPVIISIVLGAAVALVFSIALSLPSLRVSGDYLLIASIGFQLGLVQVIRNLDFMGASGGVTHIPRLIEGPAEKPAYVVVVFVVAILVALLVRWIVSGDYGRAITAMRDDEIAFTALGRNAMWIKISIFALGSAFAGIAGGLYAHFFRFIAPDEFEIIASAAILTMVVVGGMGTTWGPILGAVLLTVLPQAITFLDLPPSILGPMQGVLYTGLVLVFLFVRPTGIVAAPASWRGRHRSSPPGDVVSAKAGAAE